MRAVEALLDSPAIERPSTFVITSPALIPSRLAGDRLKTPTTSRPRLRSTTVIPTPENSPFVACSNSLFCSGVK